MFGYVLPRRDRLSEPEKARYRAAYCGLCRALKRSYGFRARFLVNYDMTFLYFLLQPERREAERCLCPARPFCKKDCLPDDAVMTHAADLTVLLSCWKLEDAARDGKLPERLAARAGLLLFRRARKKAAGRQPEADGVFGRELSRLAELEAQCCPSLDRPADAFATLLGACVPAQQPAGTRRAMQVLLYHVGRYLYLVDALEDLPKDCKSGAYNPLRYRYRPENGALTQPDKDQLLQTIEASISMAASALELLPPTPDDAIRRNIIYYGLPAVLHSVAEGSFRKRGNTKHERSL